MTVDWAQLAGSAAQLAGTPCYVMAAAPVRAALAELSRITPTGARHWLSFKTQPVRPLLDLWREWGHGVEVVSEYELVAARQAGFDGPAILVNGIGKHVWLARHPVSGLNVHLDSPAEAEALERQASEVGWRLGIRCLLPHQQDAGRPAGQFGMTVDEAAATIRSLAISGTPARGLHFHIGTNVSTVDHYATAINHVVDICRTSQFAPEYVDVGGGLPLPQDQPDFGFDRFAGHLASLQARLPSISEIWLENGRFVTARAGVLVLAVVDRKERPDGVYLICDGGRSNQAALAEIPSQPPLPIPMRDGVSRPMHVCGPTCMGPDRLGTWELPDALRQGDLLIWRDAGAYYLAGETRFSHGLAPVVWVDLNGRAALARRRERPDDWWSAWI